MVTSPSCSSASSATRSCTAATGPADVDFVVVLGSGLIGGERVPPLLASRLDSGRRCTTGRSPGGNPPMLITSGGQGPDEKLPESHAMADYLTGRGFPAEHIERGDRLRTTEENLLFSKAIMEQAKPDYRCVVVTNNFTPSGGAHRLPDRRQRARVRPPDRRLLLAERNDPRVHRRVPLAQADQLRDLRPPSRSAACSRPSHPRRPWH